MQLFQETAPETDACIPVHGIQNPTPKVPSSQTVVLLCCVKGNWWGSLAAKEALSAP